MGAKLGKCDLFYFWFFIENNQLAVGSLQ